MPGKAAREKAAAGSTGVSSPWVKALMPRQQWKDKVSHLTTPHTRDISCSVCVRGVGVGVGECRWVYLVYSETTSEALP